MKVFGMFTRWACLTFLICSTAVVAACASAPPETFYRLSSGVRAGAIPARAFTRSVVVMRAGLPESVDRPQLVTVADANRVEILEQKRWAEPLRAGISRVVAEGLAQLLGTWRVSGRRGVIDNPDCLVNLDFRRIDARVGAGVTIDAVWTVACQDGAKQMGQSVAHAPHSDQSSAAPFETLVAAHGQALDVVSRDIAQALLQFAN